MASLLRAWWLPIHLCIVGQFEKWIMSPDEWIVNHFRIVFPLFLRIITFVNEAGKVLLDNKWQLSYWFDSAGFKSRGFESNNLPHAKPALNTSVCPFFCDVSYFVVAYHFYLYFVSAKALVFQLLSWLHLDMCMMMLEWNVLYCMEEIC